MQLQLAGYSPYALALAITLKAAVDKFSLQQC
jgi:hypothetical protein